MSKKHFLQKFFTMKICSVSDSLDALGKRGLSKRSINTDYANGAVAVEKLSAERHTGDHILNKHKQKLD